MKRLPEARRPLLAACAAGHLLAAPEASAQAPLSIEQLLASRHRWQLVTAVDHTAAGATQFEERRDTSGTVALRYGLTARLEVNGRLAYHAQALRSPVASRMRRSERAGMGLAWLARPEDRWPALLLELRADLHSRFEGEERSGGAALSMTSYRSIDPVVLSVTAAWEAQRPYRRGERSVDPGRRWRLEPLVSFAVNPRVTLLAGASYSRSTAPRIDGDVVFTRRAAIGARAGLGYAPDTRNTFFLTADLGDDGDRLALQWFHEF